MSEIIINFLFPDGFVSVTNIAAQIIGFVAMATAILVYQFNRHSTIMFIKVCISLMWCLHYGLMGLWAGLAINILNVIRDAVYGMREKKSLNSPVIPGIFVAASVISVVLTWDNMWSIVPLFASVFSTLAHWQKNTKKLKQLALPGNISWLIYDFFNKSWSGTANDSFVIISIVISLIRISRKDCKD